MLVTYVLAGSIILQLIASVIAFRLIRFTGRRVAWIAISFALFLMAIRRIIPFYRIVSGNQSIPPDITNEIVGLALSALMAIGVAGIAPIFTAFKRSEDILKKKAGESMEEFYKAFQASPAIMTISDMKDRRYVEVNKAFEEKTGYSRSEIVGRTMVEMKLWANSRELEEIDKEILSKGSIYNREHEFRMKDGRLITASLSVVAISFRGQPCALAVAEDRTERTLAERELNKKIKELEIFNKAAVDRELKMIELKKKIEELKLNPPG